MAGWLAVNFTLLRYNGSATPGPLHTVSGLFYIRPFPPKTGVSMMDDTTLKFPPIEEIEQMHARFQKMKVEIQV